MKIINGEPVHFDPGEIVFTPFMGVGSEVCGAIVNKRKGVGVELKPSYFVQAQRNIAEVSKNGWNEATNQEEMFTEEDEMEDVTA